MNIGENRTASPAILVAEDEILIRFALTDSLADRGFKVFEAGSAEQAIELLESEPEIDLVFTDVRMPGGLDGLDLARWVHSHRPWVVVVITSGHVRRSEIAASETFIEKPYDIQSVVAYISALAISVFSKLH